MHASFPYRYFVLASKSFRDTPKLCLIAVVLWCRLLFLCAVALRVRPFVPASLFGMAPLETIEVIAFHA